MQVLEPLNILKIGVDDLDCGGLYVFWGAHRRSQHYHPVHNYGDLSGGSFHEAVQELRFRRLAVGGFFHWWGREFRTWIV